METRPPFGIGILKRLGSSATTRPNFAEEPAPSAAIPSIQASVRDHIMSTGMETMELDLTLGTVTDPSTDYHGLHAKRDHAFSNQPSGRASARRDPINHRSPGANHRFYAEQRHLTSPDATWAKMIRLRLVLPLASSETHFMPNSKIR